MTPAENGLRAMLANPELLESLAFNYYRSHVEEMPARRRRIAPDWNALSDEERAAWRDATVLLQRQYIRAEREGGDPDGPDGDGGEPMPILESVAA